MQENYIYSWKLNYSHGSETSLTSSWHDYNVLIDESKLFYITDGEIIINTSDGEILCRAGDIVLIPAGLVHDYYLSSSTRAKKYWFHFSLKEFGRSAFDKYHLPLKIQCKDIRVEKLFASAIKPCKTESDELLRLSSVYAIIAYYLDACGTKKKTGSHDPIDEVLIYISENLSENLTLITLSDKIHLTPNYFVRKFRSRMGTTPMKYITSVRIERAKELLATTRMTVSEIMETVGIYDAAYFSKLFKSETGYSPRTFRELSKI